MKLKIKKKISLKRRRKYKVQENLFNFFKHVIILYFDHILSYILMVIGQKHSLKPDSLKKYSLVHCIKIISGTLPQFYKIFNYIGLFVKI